jgi:hypothetical protein
MAKSSKKADARSTEDAGVLWELYQKHQHVCGWYTELQSRYIKQLSQIQDEVGPMRLAAALELHVRRGDIPVKIAELRKTLGLSPEPPRLEESDPNS